MLVFDGPSDTLSRGASGRAAGGAVAIHPQASTPIIMKRKITAIFIKGFVLTRNNNGCGLAEGPVVPGATFALHPPIW